MYGCGSQPQVVRLAAAGCWLLILRIRPVTVSHITCPLSSIYLSGGHTTLASEPSAYFRPRRTAFQSEGGHDFKLMADSVSDDRGHRFKVKADSISS